MCVKLPQQAINTVLFSTDTPLHDQMFCVFKVLLRNVLENFIFIIFFFFDKDARQCSIGLSYCYKRNSDKFYLTILLVLFDLFLLLF